MCSFMPVMLASNHISITHIQTTSDLPLRGGNSGETDMHTVGEMHAKYITLVSLVLLL